MFKTVLSSCPQGFEHVQLGATMDWITASYLTYLAVTVPLTIWVARTLSTNGQVFLEDVFTDNVRFVLLYLRTGDTADGLPSLVEVVSVKVGVVMIVLGLIHFTNVYVFNAIRRRVRMEALRTPPLPPQHVVAQ